MIQSVKCQFFCDSLKKRNDLKDRAAILSCYTPATQFLPAT